MQQTTPVLEARSIRKQFGGLVAVNDVSFSVTAGEVVGIIGPNGSGKTSFLNCLNGIYKPDAGEVLLRGQPITGASPHTVARLGVARTFQVPKVFLELTVLENMYTPVLHLHKSMKAAQDRALELLNWVGLEELQHNLGRELSGGQQKLLEFARSLMLDPDVVLLDEPMAGVHPLLREKLVDRVQELRERGKTILVVSHDMPTLYLITQDILVFHQGAVVARGTPLELRANSLVVEAYLGG